MRSILLIGSVFVLACSSTTTNNPATDSGVQPDTSVADASGQDVTQQDSGGVCTPACTGAGVACDPLDSRCKPDGTSSHVGAACTTSGVDPLCGTDTNAVCLDQTTDNFPGGYCTYEPCSATALCPLGSSCAHLGGEPDACWKNCNAPADCRSGYVCLTVDPLFTSGGSHKVCYLPDFPCNTSKDCPASKPTCNGAGGDGGGGSCG